MGGSPLPTASTPGYGLFRGKVACDCLAAWLPVYEQVLLASGLIKASIDPWQLTGGATASAGTHSQGGAFDLLYQTTEAHAVTAREMGAEATWIRKKAQGFTRDHLHGVLTGCPHNSPARYQLDAVRAGYNGLGTNGRGGKDYHPKPSARRTWQQGIEWGKAEIARIEREADMQFNDKVPGTDLTVAQCLARGAYAYAQIIEGGGIDSRLDSVAASLSELRAAVTAGDAEQAQAILDRIEVSLSVKSDTPPAA